MGQLVFWAGVELLLGLLFVALAADEPDLIRDVVDMIRRWWGVSGRHVATGGRHVRRAAAA